MTAAKIHLAETLIALADVPDAIPAPKNARKIGIHAVHRWAQRGLSGVEPLETIHVGGRRYTSREALERFFARVTEAKSGRRPGSASRGESAGRADAELATQGM